VMQIMVGLKKWITINIYFYILRGFHIIIDKIQINATSNNKKYFNKL